MNVERPFSCDICGMAYRLKQHLVRHARTTHGGDQLVCPEAECVLRFNRIDALRRHIMTVHRPMPPQPQNPAFRPDIAAEQRPGSANAPDPAPAQAPGENQRVNQVFFIPGKELEYDAEYKFTLTVDSTIRYRDRKIAPQYSYVTIKVANESVKAVTNYYIKCIQNCQKEATFPNEVLFLQVEVSFSGNSGHKTNEKVEFDWVYSKQNDSVLHPVDEIKLSDLPSNMLAIKEDAFEMGTTYTIRLKEHNSQDISAEYSFKTESAEYKGNCKVEPQSGVKGLSNFDIICDGFEGFIYEFYDKSEEDLAEKVVFNGRKLGTSEYLGALHGVRITRGNIEVYIISKECKLFAKRDLKVELSPWIITDEIMEEIKENLTSTVKLDDMKTSMNYISFIPDMLPANADRSQILDLLLEPISQVNLHTVADVKLSASTLKIVLQTLNKPTPVSVDFGLIWKTLVTVKNQADIIGKAVKFRETSQWLSTKEIKLVSVALLECLNAGLNSQNADTTKLSEERMGFDALFMLRQTAHTTGEILDKVNDILCHIHAPGLPPAKLTTFDKAFQIWAMGNDNKYPVSEMLKKDDSIPFGVSPHLLKTYSADDKYDTDLFFQTALIDQNVFSWSKSDVKSKLVSLSVAIRKKGEDLKKMKLLSSPITVKISMDNNLTKTVVKGSTLQLDPKLDPTYLDMEVNIHRIDTPPKGFVTIHFLFPPTTESLRVLLLEEFRPGYESIAESKDTVNISSSNPDYPIKYRPIDLPMFLYMGILPGKNVAINKTVDYEFEVTQNLCQLWIEGQWSSIGCVVSEATTDNETVCACNHLSIFAAAFPVPPQSIDPISDAKLFLTVLENPLVVVFVIILFIIYLMLVLWGRYKDGIDRYKGKVVVLEDNFPEDGFPYMVAVHTSARFNAGTTAHVGLKLMGKDANSRAHILSSERRKVLTRNSDDWFMIYTPKPLGVIYGVHVWHDNYGARAEWYCDRIVVYDLTERTEAIFIVEQWLAMRQGDFPEAHLVIASDTDMLNIKRMFLDNSVLGFRDTHTFLSVFVRHPRSEVTRVQRISILMCSVMVAMLCSIMFFAPATDTGTDDYHYDVGMREILISVETLVITATLTLAVLISFKRSYKVSYDQLRTTRHFRKDEIADRLSRESEFFDSKSKDFGQASSEDDKSFYKNYVRYVSKYLKGPPLAPVSLWEDEKKVQKKKVWYIIAWLCCTIIILVAAFFVMLYGLKLGFIQSQKWLTSLVMTMGEDIFVMGPGRIIFIAILLSMAFQISTKVNLHGITVKDAMLARPKNELNYLDILLAKRSHPMYAPLSSSARLALLNKKEIRRKWWNLLDFANSVFFVVVVSSVIYRLWTSHYHGVNHLHNVFSESRKKQFGTVDIDKINNISLVENYLEVTLIEVLFNLWWYNEHQFTIGIEPGGVLKYWVDDGLHKPISKPLLRQVRVVPYDCRRQYINMTTCLLPWSLRNKDENVYGENWVPAMYLDTTRKDSPWEYRERSRTLWWTNQRFYGMYGTLYDVSGYSTFLGPTMKEAQKTSAELRANSWQDWFTRACFITVTVYNVNQQTFSQVTLLFEYFVDGSMFTSITVIPVSRVILLGVWEVLFFLYAIYYTGRSGYLINRMGLMDYLKTLNNVTRVIIVFLLYLAVIIWCVHHRKSIKYSEKYLKNAEDNFFDFDKFRSTFSLLQSVLSVMLCFAIARSFMLLRGGRRLLNVYYTLIISLSLILWLIVGFLLLVFVCMRLQYLLNCQEYFRMKELILSQKMTSNVTFALLENNNVIIFILFRVLVMFFVHALFVLLLLYYLRIAKAYKPRYSDSFNFVLFLIERVAKTFKRRKSVH